MLGHLGISVGDLAAARAYYDALLPALGFDKYLDADDQFAFRPAGGKPGTHLFFYPTGDQDAYAAQRPGLQHLAFMVATRTAVGDVCDLVQRLGSEVLLEPQHFPQYPPPYYATFWLDPFGVKLEAVCHYDRD